MFKDIFLYGIVFNGWNFKGLFCVGWFLMGGFTFKVHCEIVHLFKYKFAVNQHAPSTIILHTATPCKLFSDEMRI